MGFRLVPKSVTSNDFELRNGPFLLFRRIRYSFRGPLRKSGRLAIKRFSPEKCHKVQRSFLSVSAIDSIFINIQHRKCKQTTLCLKNVSLLDWLVSCYSSTNFSIFYV